MLTNCALLKGLGITSAKPTSKQPLISCLELLPVSAIKGVLAFWISFLLMQQFGFSMNWVFISGFMVIAGHNWPFYLQFKGGRGGAVSYGLLILSYVYLINKFLINPWVFIGLLVIVGILVKGFKWTQIPFFIMAPIFVGTMIYFVGLINWTWFIIALGIYLIITTAIVYYERKYKKEIWNNV